jgi:1-acyl-sn-glycerol-3-phosphate acyltransferase
VGEFLRKYLAIAGQLLWYLPYWALAKFYCRADVTNRLTLPPKKTGGKKIQYVIAGNHQSRLDAFIITGILGPKYWRHLWPYRYITANQYLYSWYAWWILWPQGGFPAYPTNFEGYGLRQARKLTESGQTVCIFPEGQRAIPGEHKAKRGVGELANIPGTYIIPIKLQWQLNPRKITVIIGQAYDAEGQTPEQILQTIYALK